MKHFGVTVAVRKYSLELKREEYAIIDKKNSLIKLESMAMAYEDETGTTYTDEWCQMYQQLILQNFDLNMRFFASLNHDEFQNELDKFLKKNKGFVEVFNLTTYSGVSGYYIMVLDKYCQVYIGTTNDIKKRIQQHWSKRKSFDRLLCPMYAVEQSVLSIDSFRALDTTRIYAYATKRTYIHEDKYINAFTPKFVSNRINGGMISENTVVKSKELQA